MCAHKRATSASRRGQCHAPVLAASNWRLATCNQSHQWHRCRFMVAGVNGPISEELWQRVKMKSQPANWVSVMKLDTQKGKGCMHSSESQKSQQWGAPPGGRQLLQLANFCHVAKLQVASMTANAESTSSLSLSLSRAHTLSITLSLSLSPSLHLLLCSAL